VNSVLPLWFEIGSMAILIVILIIDLLLIIRRPHAPSMREASLWVGFYVLLALVFAGCIFLLGDVQHGTEFLAGWLTEYSLSIDNLFVFVLIIGRFKVPYAYQQRALMIGIVLALIFRGLFILAGAALINNFSFIFYLFGAWLVWTAWQQVRGGEEDEGDSWLIRQLKKVIPMTDQYDGGKLRTRIDGQRAWTPFLFLLIALGTTDLLFALDSIPAIFGITHSPFIVFTANVFALMGLRQLYFLLGGLLDRLIYLKYGIAFILAFIGVKLVFHAMHVNELPFINGGEAIEWAPEISIWLSLGVIVVSMAVATLASLIHLRRDARAHGERLHLGAYEDKRDAE